jgi:hypothetical protein
MCAIGFGTTNYNTGELNYEDYWSRLQHEAM